MPYKYKSDKAAQMKAWHKANPEYRKNYMSTWQKNNKGKTCANSSKYRAAMLNRTPSWANMEDIKAVYEACPEGLHVDHIEPLQGKDVSGLHVAWNLQYLTPYDNISKGNRRT